MPEVYGSDFLLIEQLLAQFDIEVPAPEADGRLSGLAAMLGADALPVWLEQLLQRPDETIDALRWERADQLRIVGQKRLAVIEEGSTLPTLCLPDDDDDLRDRVDGLVQWSMGFLSGLAEGAALRGTPARDQLNEEPLSEMVTDLTEITQATVSDEDINEDPESAEAAYVELVEFLRIACQLAYENLASLRATQSAQPSQNIH